MDAQIFYLEFCIFRKKSTDKNWARETLKTQAYFKNTCFKAKYLFELFAVFVSNTAKCLDSTWFYEAVLMICILSLISIIDTLAWHEKIKLTTRRAQQHIKMKSIQILENI